MAIISPKRFQRSRFHQTEKTQQLIAFQSHQEWFALPIGNVVKVIPQSTTYGDPNGAGTGLTTYQNQALLTLNIAQHIFGSVGHTEPTNYLVIVRTQAKKLIAIPLSHTPAVRQVPHSAFTPLPADYAKKINSICVRSLVSEPGQPTQLLINPERLLAAKTNLAESSSS